MRFIHLSDLHLGKTVNEFSMLEDQKYILDEILTLAEKEKVDALVIAGDLYDKAVPNEGAVNLLDWFLTTAAQRHLAVIAISGNHDSEDRLNFGTHFFTSHDVYLTARYEGNVPCASLQDEYGPVHFWMLPYVKKSVVEHYHADQKLENYDQAIRLALQDAKINPAERNVILSHQFVTRGDNIPEGSGSETWKPQTIGTIEQVDYHAYDDFDYVALGHIHRPQMIGRETCRYSGSPLKYSASEIGQIKSVPVVTMKEKGDVKVEFAELKPLRDMRQLRGHFKDLLKPENVLYPDDYIFMTLLDEEPIANAMEIASRSYPHIMSLNYDNSHTRGITNLDFSEVNEQRSFPELFVDFYEQVYGTKPGEEEMKIMKEIGEKAGLR